MLHKTRPPNEIFTRHVALALLLVHRRCARCAGVRMVCVCGLAMAMQCPPPARAAATPRRSARPQGPRAVPRAGAGASRPLSENRTADASPASPVSCTAPAPHRTLRRSSWHPAVASSRWDPRSRQRHPHCQSAGQSCPRAMCQACEAKLLHGSRAAPLQASDADLWRALRGAGRQAVRCHLALGGDSRRWPPSSLHGVTSVGNIGGRAGNRRVGMARVVGFCSAAGNAPRSLLNCSSEPQRRRQARMAPAWEYTLTLCLLAALFPCQSTDAASDQAPSRQARCDERLVEGRKRRQCKRGQRDAASAQRGRSTHVEGRPWTAGSSSSPAPACTCCGASPQSPE